MRTFILSFTFLLVASITAAQQIRLEEGERFSFHSSNFFEAHHKFPDREQDDFYEEEYDKDNILFEVIKVHEDHYEVKATLETDQTYSRQKVNEEDGWETSVFYYKELVQSYQIPPKITIFDLSFDGTISNEKEIEGDKPSAMDVTMDFSGFFFPIPESVEMGQILKKNGDVYVVDQVNADYIKLIKSKKEENFNHKSTLLVNKKGIVIEEVEHTTRENRYQPYYVHNNKPVKVYADQSDFGSTQLIANNTQPFSCTFMSSSNLTEKDTILTETNIRIRGKITNPDPDNEIILAQIENKPRASLAKTFKQSINPDGTFELRAKIDRFTNGIFIYGNKPVDIYLFPGDDLYLEFDGEHFPETIQASGIGSGHINFIIEKDRFEEAHQLKDWASHAGQYDIFRGIKPDEVKKRSLEILEKKLRFLKTYHGRIAPEVFLAEYWDYHAKHIDVLHGYLTNLKTYQGNDGVAPLKEIDERRFSNFDSLIHPDNDLMAFTEGFDNNIQEYVLSFVNSKIKHATGVGNAATPNDQGVFHNSFYISRYNLAHGAFSGMTQHVLKYKTVEDALLRADWNVFKSLYERFKNEYPYANRTKLLDGAYEKGLSVQPGQPAFNFELKDFDGNTVHLSDFKGRVVYLYFWDPNNRRKIDWYKEKMNKITENEHIEIIYIATSSDIGTAKDYMKDLKLSGTKLYANGPERLSLMDKYFFRSLSHSVIIDPEGRIFDPEAPSPNDPTLEPQLLLKALDPG